MAISKNRLSTEELNETGMRKKFLILRTLISTPKYGQSLAELNFLLNDKFLFKDVISKEKIETLLNKFCADGIVYRPVKYYFITEKGKKLYALMKDYYLEKGAE